jgi:hypothetical protein
MELHSDDLIVKKENTIYIGKVKFWSKMAIGAIRAKLFFQLFSNKT